MIRTIAANGWRCFRVLMHLLILLLIKICDFQSNFCIAYICSFRSRWHIMQRKRETKNLASKFIETRFILELLGEQSTYEDATRISIKFSSLIWVTCNGKQPYSRTVHWFWTGETFVQNRSWKTKLKSILVQALTSPPGPSPKGIINARVDKEQNSMWMENYFRV